jgi:3',5'-cyclic AMP phosphodiesterase CpdA
LKVVHLTDLHVQTPPRISEMTSKRLLGSVNLYVLGRKRKFSLAVQQAAVAAAVAQEPDVVVFTGDITAQALDSEFAAAEVLLEPILSRFPTVLIPGNHDTYVKETIPGERMRQRFGRWMGDRAPWLHVFDDIAFLYLETCRLDTLSRGLTTPEQIAEAEVLLEKVGDRFVFLCQHYPLRGRGGEVYGPSSRALRNANLVEDFLARTDRIGAILHGHEHHGFTVDINTGGGPRPILNPGACGYSWLPKQNRTAHLNIYEVNGQGIQDIQRLRYDGSAFVPEPGGAYATGR